GHVEVDDHLRDLAGRRQSTLGVIRAAVVQRYLWPPFSRPKSAIKKQPHEGLLARASMSGRSYSFDACSRPLKDELLLRELLKGHRHRLGRIDIDKARRPFEQLARALGSDHHQAVAAVDLFPQHLEGGLVHHLAIPP